MGNLTNLFQLLTTLGLLASCTGGPASGQQPELRVADAGATAPDPAPLPVGMNLRMVGPRNRSWAFVDALRMSSTWRYDSGAVQGKQARRAQRAGGSEVPTDERGWPRPEADRSAMCGLFADQDGHYPAGTYVFTWEGSAKVAFRGAARVSAQEGRRMEVEVTPARGVVELVVSEVDHDDPIRDMHLWMPGFERAESSFHPLFLERLAPFSVLRFYPWMRPFSSSGSWANRPRPDDARQSGDDGVALELMLELVNTLRADPWFCIPHTADEEYIRAFATQVRERLHPGGKVWVELSNELWNMELAPAQAVRDLAQQNGEQVVDRISALAGNTFRIFQEVFGDDKDRVVRVVAGHLMNPSVARRIAQGLDGELDALAVGAYFGARPGKDQVQRATTPGDLLAVAVKNLEQLVLPRIADHRTLADALEKKTGRRIRLVTYEGGQHVIARSSNVGAAGLDPRACQALQELPGMYDAYRRLLEGGAKAGLELFLAYDFVGGSNDADTFAHLTYLDEPLSEAPKFRALVEGRTAGD